MLELKQKYGTVAIANLGGHSEEEYVEGAAMLSDSAVDIVELNISCPNVKVGGMAYGVKAEAAGEVVRMVRAACKKPLMVKLSPQAENIPEMCKAVEAAGADAITPDQHLPACAIDLESAARCSTHLCRLSGRPSAPLHCAWCGRLWGPSISRSSGWAAS